MYTPEKMDLIKAKTLSPLSQFQAFRWWGVSKKLVGRGKKLKREKIGQEKSPLVFFPHVSFCARCVRFNSLLTSDILSDF